MPSWLSRSLAALLVLLVVAIAALTLLLPDGRDRLADAATPWRGSPAESAPSVEHREAAAAAEEVALAFLRVDHRDMQAVVDAVLERATGDFAEQYAAQRDRLTAEALRSRAVATPAVVAAGVVELEDATATVLVAADSVVRNDEGEQRPEPRHYRLRIELARVDGRWLASGVEFVR